MASAGSIFVDLLLRDSSFNQGINRARTNTKRAFSGISKDADQAARSIQGIVNPVSAVTSAFRSLAVVAAASFSVRAISQYADTWSDLRSRVNLAIGEFGNADEVMQRLNDIARRTYSSFENTAEGFLRNSTVLKELGYNTQQTLDYIEAVNNALVVSGAKGQTAVAVMNNLSQAMALGTLQGQNLVQILQSGGRVTELIAEEMGVTTTRLRELGREGKITGDVIYNTLTRNLERLRAEADRMPATIADGFLLIRNSLLQTVGVFDQANNISEKFSRVLIGVADNMETILKVAAAVSIALSTNLVRSVLSSMSAFFAANAQAVAYQLTLARMAGVSRAAAAGIGIVTFAVRGLSVALSLVGGWLGLAAIGLVYIIDKVGGLENAAASFKAAMIVIGSEIRKFFNNVGSIFSAVYEGMVEIAKRIGDVFSALGDGIKSLIRSPLSGGDFSALEAELTKGFSSAFSKAYEAARKEAELFNKDIDAATEKAIEGIYDSLNAARNKASNGLNQNKPPLNGDGDSLYNEQQLEALYKRNRELIYGITSAQVRYNDSIKELNALLNAGKITQEQYSEAVRRAQDELDKASEKANVWAFDIEAAGKRASENIHQSFADFLFDPFEKGLSGMLDGFVTMLRRMAAEAAAAQILGGLFGQGGIMNGGGGALSGIGSFLGNTFAGMFATGGVIPPGQWGIAGEAGPEIIMGGSSGATVIPQGAATSKGVTVNVINNAGANVSTRPGSDGASLDVLIDMAVANNISMPGTRTNQALGNFNSRSLVKR